MKESAMDIHPRSELEDTIERNLECAIRLTGEDAAPPPVGSLGIVFTDIKNSTVLWEASSDAMLKALEIHDRVMRNTIRTHGGYEVKVIGDAFMVAFSSPVTALSWCLMVQQDLLEAEWPQEVLEHECGKEVLDKEGQVIFRGLSVRMGGHFGVPIDKDDEVTKRKDYIGPVVHRAARAIEVADGGQIVVTREFLTGCQEALTDLKGREDARHPSMGSALLASAQQRLVIRDIGDQELKGLSNPLHLYQILPSSLRGRRDNYSEASFTKGLWDWLTG